MVCSSSSPALVNARESIWYRRYRCLIYPGYDQNHFDLPLFDVLSNYCFTGFDELFNLFGTRLPSHDRFGTTNADFAVDVRLLPFL